MKMVKKRTKGGQRVLAAFLSLLFVLALFPASVFAWSPGQSVSSYYGDNIIGSDGSTYNLAGPWQYMKYNSDGTVSYNSWNVNMTYQYFYLVDSSGYARWVYCIEAGVNFKDSSNEYISESGTNSSYMNLLPASVQHNIMLTSLYGWQPGQALPISGINEADWYMATQVILWEFQQQLRGDAHSRHDNGPVPANQFYSIVQGRPAERAYNYILDSIAAHDTIPSFAASSASGAQELELKWDSTNRVYSLTVTDTNNLNMDFARLAGSGVTVTRSGNRYTFTSSSMIQNAVTLQYRKDVPAGEAMLIWGRPGFQTMMTGANDPVSFYVKIKTESYGTARVIKTSEDGIVSGISFTIRGTDILGNTVNTTVTTGSNGRVDKQLMPGTYKVEEVAVDRYVPPAAQYITVESGQTDSVSFSNVLKKFRVVLTKSDADTGVVQGNASLAGAVYGIYKGGELIDTYTTDANGSFTTGYYVCGDDWTVREISPSTGYLLDTAVHSVGAQAKLYQVEYNSTNMRVTEQVIYGNLRLIKHTDEWDEDIAEDERDESGNTGMIEQPEAGAVFEIFLRSAGSYANAKATERDRITTDADGFAESKMLPYGYYTVHQIAGIEGKAFIPDFTVFISSNGYTYSYILNNNTITGRLRVEKHDAETGETVLLSGVGFKVKSLGTGEFVQQTVWYPNPVIIDTYYTADEGWLMLPEELPTGDYALYEVQAPHGYVLDGTPIPFTVDGSEAVVSVKQQNNPQKGQITISKTGEVFATIEETEDGTYLPVYEVMGLPGAVYDLIADEDIYTADGTLRAAEGTVVETLTTSEDTASATSGLLYLGRYRLEERTAPAGMVLDPEPIYAELTYAGQEIEITHTGVSAYDERQRVEIDLVKAMEVDALWDIGFGEEYQGLAFGLYSQHDIMALDGTVIPADGLLEIVSLEPVEVEQAEEPAVDEELPGGEEAPEVKDEPESDPAEGREDETEDEAEGEEPAEPLVARYAAAFSADLPFGSFYVQEISTDKSYVLNDTKYPVVFAYEGQEVAVVSLSANGGEDIENRILRGDVQGIKYGEAIVTGEEESPEDEQDEDTGSEVPVDEDTEAVEETEGGLEEAEGNGEVAEDEDPAAEDGRMPLAGALIGLFHPDAEEMTEETAIVTYLTDEDGYFRFEGIPYGHWIIAEIAAPYYYTISPEQHHIYIGVDGQFIEISIDNSLMRGSVQLMKTEAVVEPSALQDEDAEKFLRILGGAVFALYQDTNENGELDEEDTLLGELEEYDTGFHRFDSLLQGGYFVVETVAPEGCILDETVYYFEISHDGQVAIIENGETGMGFINEAYRGDLRILKDSSDGRKDGFTFEVRSADGSYSETFTTDSTGIIDITGLRIGWYTVTELSTRATTGYILPDPVSFEVMTGDTVVVSFFNEIPEEPEEPDEPEEPETPTPEVPATPKNPSSITLLVDAKPVPQTSDDGMVLVYIALLGVALIGGAVCVVLSVKRGKGSKRRKGSVVAALLCVAVIAASGAMFVQEASEYAKSAGAYESLGNFVTDGEYAEGNAQEREVALPTVDFTGLRALNPDTLAWLVCEDTAISYPVAQGEDNDYYLKHLLDGTYSKAGCLFVDYENAADFSDSNTIIYGHNLLDGSMFSDLTEYQKQAYYEEHPTMLLVTQDGSYVVEIFAAFTASPNEAGTTASPWLIAWEDEAAYAAWLETAQARSVIESDVDVGASDNVLTLSTCIGNGRNRFVVLGRLVETA